ncbi:MAG: protein kinase [Polyangiaceae bacterium]|nr:protein kinase [Polyangiaceae bacterium]
MRSNGPTEKVCPSCRGSFIEDSLFCPNDGSPLELTHDPYIGEVIHGDIEIQSLLGVGAMGRVYRAHQKGIERDVAVKILHRELSTNAEIVARFDREAKLASRLHHVNVVQVFLTGQLSDRSLYMVMEYLDGVSLQAALTQSPNHVFPLQRALKVIVQLCDAVGEAHDQNIVHRDLKPENVMLVRRSQDPDFVKVLDFGIARANWGESSMSTQKGLIFGTARFISPEGAQGESVGPEGDVYAIATLLYLLLSGQTPFDGEQTVGILLRQIAEPPAPIRSLPACRTLPEPVAAVVMRGLSKERSARPANARAMGRAILSAAAQSGLQVDDVVTRPSVLDREEIRRASSSGPAPAEAKKTTDLEARTHFPAHTVPPNTLPPTTQPFGPTQAVGPSPALAQGSMAGSPLPTKTSPMDRVSPAVGTQDPHTRAVQRSDPEFSSTAKIPHSPLGPQPSLLQQASPMAQPYAPQYYQTPQPPQTTQPPPTAPPFAAQPFGTTAGWSGPFPSPSMQNTPGPAYGYADPNAGFSPHSGDAYGPRPSYAPPPPETDRRPLLIAIALSLLIFAGLVLALGSRSGWFTTKSTPQIAPTATPSTPAPTSSTAPSTAPSVAPLGGIGDPAAQTSKPNDVKIALAITSDPLEPVAKSPVQLVSTLTTSFTPKRVEKGLYTISGPGLGSPLKINAVQVGSTWTASFTPPLPGDYEVAFSLRIDQFAAKKVYALRSAAGTGGPAPGGTQSWQ